MNDENKRVQAIKNMVIRGLVQHSEIRPVLNKIECSQINPDEIVKLTLKYKFGNTKRVDSKINNGIWSIADKIITIIITVISGVVFAEVRTAKIFADSIIGDKLSGFGDNLLFWLGKKSINMTGLEMITAMSKAFQATPEILKWLLIGAITGYISWKAISRLAIFIYKRERLNNDIKRLLKIYPHQAMV